MHSIIRAVSRHPLVAVLFLCAAWGSLEARAQTTPQPAPARETPRPQDIDPAVDTSRAPELPRPQEVNPGVDTSAAQPSAPATSSGTAGPTGTAARKPTPSNGAVGANDAAKAGAPQPGGAARTQVRGKALDRLELDTTQITGNRELPKVLYIVPWKRADLGDLVGKPVNSLLDEVLTPVDRDVFKRQNRYYRALMPDGASAAAGATGSASDGAGAAPGAKDER
jgi:hypothetical protein